MIIILCIRHVGVRSFSALGSASQQLHQQQQMQPRKMLFVFGLLCCCRKVLIAAAVCAAAATTPMRPTLLCVFSMYYRKPLITDPFASAISSKSKTWNKKNQQKNNKNKKKNKTNDIIHLGCHSLSPVITVLINNSK